MTSSLTVSAVSFFFLPVQLCSMTLQISLHPPSLSLSLSSFDFSAHHLESISKRERERGKNRVRGRGKDREREREFNESESKEGAKGWKKFVKKMKQE